MELCLIQRPITIFLPPIISGMMLSTVVHRNFDGPARMFRVVLNNWDLNRSILTRAELNIDFFLNAVMLTKY
jgi:hypothetical protein